MKKLTPTPAPPRVLMTVREAVHSVVLDAAEPLSAAEVRLRYTALTGRRIDQSAVNKALRLLAHRGEVFARLETTSERHARSGGVPARGRVGRLYSTTSPVPQRTSKLRDIVLGDGQASRRAPRGAQPQPRAVSDRAARDTRVDLVREVTRLVDRVARLESQLAEARRAVSE
jgi:hypothetical protein